MKHTTFSALVLLIALAIPLQSKCQTLEFAITIPSDFSGYTGWPESISYTPDGNIVVAGFHSKGLYFSTFNPNGIMIWRYVLLGSPQSTTVRMKTDKYGCIYLFGNTNGSFDADASSDVVVINNGSFLLKYGPTGKYLWGRSRGGNTRISKAIDFDSIGNCYVVGEVNQYNAYLEKYDQNGEYIWGFEYDEYCAINTIVIDSLQCIMIAGETLYGRTIDIDNGPDTVSVGNSTSNRAFIARYNSDGNYLNSIDVGGLSYGSVITPISLAIDPNNNVVISGDTYGDSIDVDPSANNYFLGKNGRMFIAKYTSQLSFLWALQLQGDDSVTHLSLDNKGNIYSTGRIGSDSIEIDPGNGTVRFYANNSARRGYADIFFGMYSSDGEYRWGYVCNSPGYDWATCSVPDNKGSVYFAGMIYGDSIDFDPSPATVFLSSEKSTSNPKQNIISPFIAKYSVPTNAVSNSNRISSEDLSIRFASDKLHVECTSNSHDDIVINMYDALGKNVLSSNYHPASLGTQDIILPFANQASGLYLCELKIGNTRRVTKLIVTK